MARTKADEQGVYEIRNNVTGVVYIGGTSNFTQRRSSHFWFLKKGRHKNSALQDDFSRHGITAFSTRLLEVVSSKDDLAVREQFWLDKFSGVETGGMPGKRGSYNEGPARGSKKGRVFSEAARVAMSEAAKKRWASKVEREEQKKRREVFIANNPEWGVEHSARMKGTPSPRRTVPDKVIRKIRLLHSEGKSINELSRRFSLSQKSTSHIVRRLAYRDIV